MGGTYEEIPLRFGLFWSGAPMSLLRFLTFVSIRKHHPDSKIDLYISKNSGRSASWKKESQDFLSQPSSSEKFCYISELYKLSVNIYETDFFPTFSPNYQSDLFRWWYLKNYGGFYLDTDQIVVRSFTSLPLHCDFIYSAYRTRSCGLYTPVGALGAKKGSTVASDIIDSIMKFYDPSDYSSLGPPMFREMLKTKEKEWEDLEMFNAPPATFYPFSESRLIKRAYSDSSHISPNSLAVHWFGGHKESQAFNCKFSEEFAKTNDDLISNLCKPLLEYWEGI